MRDTVIMVPAVPVFYTRSSSGTFAPDVKAQEVMSSEIVRYLADTYHKPVGLAVLWPVTQETERARKFRGCNGTWEEIRKCVDEKE